MAKLSYLISKLAPDEGPSKKQFILAVYETEYRSYIQEYSSQSQSEPNLSNTVFPEVLERLWVMARESVKQYSEGVEQYSESSEQDYRALYYTAVQFEKDLCSTIYLPGTEWYDRTGTALVKFHDVESALKCFFRDDWPAVETVLEKSSFFRELNDSILTSMQRFETALRRLETPDCKIDDTLSLAYNTLAKRELANITGSFTSLVENLIDLQRHLQIIRKLNSPIIHTTSIEAFSSILAEGSIKPNMGTKSRGYCQCELLKEAYGGCLSLNDLRLAPLIQILFGDRNWKAQLINPDGTLTSTYSERVIISIDPQRIDNSFLIDREHADSQHSVHVRDSKLVGAVNDAFFDATGLWVEIETCYCGAIPVASIAGIYVHGSRLEKDCFSREEIQQSSFKADWKSYILQLKTKQS